MIWKHGFRLNDLVVRLTKIEGKVTGDFENTIFCFRDDIFFLGALECCLLGRKSGRWCRRFGGKRRQTARLVEGKEHICISYQFVSDYHVSSYQCMFFLIL